MNELVMSVTQTQSGTFTKRKCRQTATYQKGEYVETSFGTV
jgi:hypothetical protein